jgi:hypothetical protein
MEEDHDTMATPRALAAIGRAIETIMLDGVGSDDRTDPEK